eukprot:TRINITY_DN20512_c0_g1_i1.p1 TRINITY_DN20512_c0_g1~~TRINITY_DN20512_c0_g1_i1.p1  ORF type:complete len:963 (+),score=348.14 TRINITY_DN20512_c0_g1_i1:66-2954(+)
MSKQVGIGRKDVHASGACVMKLPSMKKEQKRFALFQKDASNQHNTKFEFYAGAMGHEKPLETWELGLDFKLKVDEKAHSMEVKRKKDGQVLMVTFYKAPCTRDVAATMKQFIDAMQFLGDKEEGKVKPLDETVKTDDATLDVQGGSGGGGGGGGAGGAATTSTKSNGGSAPGETRTNPKPGLTEIISQCPEGRCLCYENETGDTQFKITYTFKNVEGSLKPSKDAQKKGADVYYINVYPNAKVEMARGKWNGQSRQIASGQPDKEYMDRQAKANEELLANDIKNLREVLKKKGVKKACAEDIAAVCSETGTPFVDLTFPPGKTSLYREWETGMKDAPWMKPSQYLPPDVPPALFVGSVEPEDIDQGSLGDCYLLSALACLSEFEPLVTAIFDDSQDYSLGIYRATLCKNGWWHTIVMDSYLPSNGSLPCFAKNREEPNELWVALLEKAYAKLHGSYASIRAGSGGMALADLTGCPYELFDDSKMTPELFATLEENDRNDYIQMLGTPGKDTSDYAGGAATQSAADMSKKYEAVGLACGHAYSLITVKEYKGNQLCMIRNPWGNDKEWNGDWSDKSKKWTDDIKKAVGWYDGDDGTFWMCWKDVCKWFTSASVCYVNGAWDQIRVAATYVKGVADLALKLEVKKDSQAWVGVHQRDSRGFKKGAEGTKYIPVQLNIMESDGKDGLKVVVSPPFKPSRDQNHQVSFQKGKTYYVFAQSSDDSERSFVYSMHCEMSEFADVRFLTPGKDAKKYNPVTTFAPVNYEPTEAIYQIKGIFSTNSSVVERQGAAIDFSNSKRVLSAKEKQIKKNPSGSYKGLAQYISFPLEVTALCGRGLPAMDDNGLSDPYLEFKLRSMKNGKIMNSHVKPQSQVTPAIDQTLTPKWNSKHPFSCSGDDVLHVTCYDKDTKGKDYMGEFYVVLGEMDLTPGATPIKKTFKLTGEIEESPGKKSSTKGEIDLAFAIPKA